jgi:hypothetical protein
MNNKDWKKWAAISEVFGTFAVVVSLIFVGISIRQNTAVVQADQQNLLYELWDSSLSDSINNPELYELHVKGEDPEALTLTERARLVDLEHRGLNIWENAYFKYKTGLLSEEQYKSWHDANVGWVECCMRKWIWDDFRESEFRSDFTEMIDAIIAGRK